MIFNRYDNTNKGTIILCCLFHLTCYRIVDVRAIKKQFYLYYTQHYNHACILVSKDSSFCDTGQWSGMVVLVCVCPTAWFVRGDEGRRNRLASLSLGGGKVTPCQSLCLTAECGGLVENNRTRSHHVVLVWSDISAFLNSKRMPAIKLHINNFTVN